MKQPRRASQVLLLLGLAVPALFARKAQPVLDWKTAVLWASPDPCYDFLGFSRGSFVILDEDIVYHVSHRTPIGHKPNVTEGSAVKYAMPESDFYLQDEDGRVFKLTVVKKESIPNALERLKNGQQLCRP